jgi:radical SAM PhpK family P-methyltransferase
VKKIIDCLLIGHNEPSFLDYEKSVRKMGINSGAYRDLNLNFVQYNYKPYSVPEIFNLFNGIGNGSEGLYKPFSAVETFSAAIAYLGTFLNRRGYTFDFINSFQDEKEELARKLEQENILTIAITTTLYVVAFPIMEIMDFIKKYNQSAKIIIGGPFIANQIRELDDGDLEYLFESIGADFYVNSAQGEAALVKLINALKNNRSVDQVENIHYKDGKGYVATPMVREDNMLSQNMVNWDWFSSRVGEFVNIRTAISCPFNCSFCGLPGRSGKYQFVDAGEIEKELNLLNKIETVKSVQVIDDTFNVPVNRFKEILRMMLKNKYRFQWHSHFRCQFADREMIELMKESGCEGVFLGIESGNNQILKNMNKASTVEKYLHGIELLREYDILTYGSFIIGFPGETEKTASETIQFIKDSGLDFYRAQLWYCEIFTRIWQEREKYNIIGSHFEWSHATMDSKTACDIIDKVFLMVDDPIWVPQHNFECEGLFQLIHRGIPLHQVKNLLKAFNNGIKEKLINPSTQEMSFDVIKQLKCCCQEGEEPQDVLEKERSLMEKYEDGFDY